MINCIRFCVNHAAKVRKLGLHNPHIAFGPRYNVLIGPNGSGKSTVLKALASCPRCVIEKTTADAAIKYVTTETLNPLAGGGFTSREAMFQGVRSMFMSHGQGVLDSLRNQRHDSEAVVLIDSPETGQDHQNSVAIYEGLLKMSERYQVIVATNSLVFMRGGHLIDLGEGTLARLLAETHEMLSTFDNNGKSEILRRA